MIIRMSHLHIYTDGGENYSTPGECGNFDYDHINIFDFTLDARDAFKNSVVDSEERNWVEQGSEITQKGRAYRLTSGSTEYDWAGGVLPGSWEWRVYYRAAWGDSRAIRDEENLEWGPPVSEGEVVMSITTFVEEIFQNDTTVAASMLSSPTSASGIELPSYYSVVSPSSLSTTVSSLPSTEDTLFAGLAKLTRGRYTKVQKGDRSPILGDIDLNGEVDEIDLRLVYTWFGRAVDSYNQGAIDADVTLDDFVDNADMMYVRYNWTDEDKAAPLMGDIDYNWCVDYADLSKVLQWYGQPVNPRAQSSYHADINADGYIDNKDVDIVEGNLGQGCLNW